jgi:mRNA-degrading endonuclease RelE of RelBE toxin-antitoxin system
MSTKAYTLQYKATVLKQLKQLQLSEKKKVLQKLSYLQENPLMGKQLKGGLSGLRSLRAWPYRIVYEIKGEKIVVLSVAHRKELYK